MSKSAEWKRNYQRDYMKRNRKFPGPKRSVRERAAYWRDKAEECRGHAERCDGDGRVTLLNIADGYEALARAEEMK